ncbi:MAG: TRAP transporter large permease [Oscillospiraceae bacterium]|nr:TRAP transporter large permease [Oscillospiraceae bacterium]
MSPTVIGIIGVVAFFVLLVLKKPVALAMALVGFTGFSVLTSFNSGLYMVSTELFTNLSSYSLSVIPMFVWMGYLAYHSGIGTDLYNFAYKMIGHRSGGLAAATQVACAMFGAICGSNTATAATMGAIALPEMRKYKYDDSLSTGSIAAGAAMGMLIPPSVIFIVYGMATEQSIGKLFMAGIVPGILLMLIFIGIIVFRTVRNPALGPKGPTFSWEERFKALGKGLGETLAIFLISMGGLAFGLFTPTEAGAVGVGGVLLVSVLRRRMTLKKLISSLKDTTKTSAMIMLIIAGAMMFGRFMSVSRLPFELANWTSSLHMPSFIVMAVIILIYLVLGTFIDGLAMIVLTIPIFYPVVVNSLGYSPIWFGVIIVMVVALAEASPPVGMNVFIIKGIAKDISVGTIFKGMWPFMIGMLILIAILMAFPGIATFIPNLLVK